METERNGRTEKMEVKMLLYRKCLQLLGRPGLRDLEMSQETTEVVRLGAGSFATIYVWQSRNNIAIKCVADRTRSSELYQEFGFHQQVYAACSDGKLIFRIPRPVKYWSSLGELLKHVQMDEEQFPSELCVYTMQRVWPIPPVLASSISERYFPTNQSGYRKPFIARIYLGRPPQRSQQLRASRFFNANNFPLDASRCKELGLPVELLAQDMAKVLARIHYHSGLDGRDIEFVVGGDEVDSYSEHGFFCFDFNQCKPHEGNVDLLVTSFFDNDPYYPRPGMDYWEDFKNCYLQEASLAPKGNDSLQLAEMFVSRIEMAVAAKTAGQAPEGRGNEMALFEAQSQGD